MKKILITGGCGFIGVNLIHHLREKFTDLDITVLDNESLGKKEFLSNLNVKFIHGDICDFKSTQKAVHGAEAVIHLAADTRVLDSILNPVKNFENNVLGTFNLLNTIRIHQTPIFINASTGGAIIGDAKPPVHENILPMPLSPYGASKLAIEGYCSAFHKSYGINTISLRFSNVYGPRSYHKGSVVAAFYKKIINGSQIEVFGDGTQIRDFVYIDDICNAIINSLHLKTPGVYQLGSGIPTTINELIKIMRSVVNSKYKIDVLYKSFNDGEIHTTYCNIEKAKQILNYEAHTDLINGLTKTWNWFESQR